MSNMVLQCKDGGDLKPHPEGIRSVVCLDVIDLGQVETVFQSQRRMTPKVKVVFESELRSTIARINSHRDRDHQGLQRQITEPAFVNLRTRGSIDCRKRLCDILRCYYRKAA